MASVSSGVRVRIAPSPTGTLHVGTARSALYNYLYAKQHGGTFIVRLEDTDEERSTRAYEQSIIDGLRWLGLSWDEGPDTGGAHGPYRQSERRSMHAEHLTKLIDAGKAYRCFCTKEQLEADREHQRRSSEAPRYTGRCRELQAAETADRVQAGERNVIRFKTPRGGKIVFDDLIRGRVETSSDTLDDFVLAKGEEAVLYNFAVVVDDALMEISHVIRGEDHITNTAKQLLLFDALGFAKPLYAHLPLILDTKRRKLSKRAGATAVEEFRAEGYLPEALINYLALVGWNPKTTEERFTLDALVAQFDLTAVHRGGAVFDEERLRWLNAEYLRSLGDAELLARAGPFLPKPEHQELASDAYVNKVLNVAKTRVQIFSELTEVTEFFFVEQPEYAADIIPWKKQEPHEAKEVLEQLAQFLETIPPAGYAAAEIEKQLRAYVQERSMKNGELLWPFRVALTGKERSAGPFEVAEVLGKERTIARVRAACEKLP